MKAKYLLTALALPALFAACSQEDIITDGQMPQSPELLGKVAGDVVFNLGAESRLAWGTTGDQTWEAGDEFSLFWVSNSETRKGTTESNGLEGTANALYKTSDGVNFSSENIVYVGKHLLVYPAQKNHYKAGDIVVTADSVQNGAVALGKRSVYTSDSLITILPPLEDDEKPVYGVVYAAGYNEAVKASTKPLTSNFVLNLAFDMPENINEVTIKKVSLVAGGQIFSTKGTLNATNDSIIYSPSSEKAEKVTLELPANTKVTKSKNTYAAQIALLPVANDADYYAIEVVTNYGVVTIDSAKYVKNAKGQYLCSNTTKQDASFKFNELTADARVLDLGQEFALTNNISNTITYRGNEMKIDNSYGKRITANVTVKMSEADINNMEVANSEELVAAYETYNLLGKGQSEDEPTTTFVLKNKKAFELTPDAVKAILNNTKVSLTQSGNDTIKLVGAHTEIPALQRVVDNRAVEILAKQTATNLVLGAEGTWTIDVDLAPAARVWKKIINEGTLTISESNPSKNAAPLDVAIENRDSVIISGEVEIPVAYVQKAGATNILADSYLKATSNAGNMLIEGGKVYVNGYWSVEGGNVTNEATVDVTGILNTTSGSFTNVGTIKLLSANAYAIITDNAVGVTNGSIESYARNSQAKVTNAATQGYIKWNCDVEEYEYKTSDTFNYAILSGNLTVKSQGNLKHVEIAEGKQVSLAETIGNETAARAAEGSEEPVIKTTLDLGLVKVNKNATLIVPTGSEITYMNFVNNGRKELISGSFTDSNSSVEDLIAYGRNVTLARDMESIKIPTGYAGEIDLNQHSVSSVVNNGNLKIKNGKITSQNGQAVKSPSGNLTLENVEVSGQGFAIEVNGGSATIKNSKVASTTGGDGVYAIGVENCSLTIENVDFADNKVGGVSAVNSNLTLKGKENAAMTLTAEGGSRYALHVYGTTLTYNNYVNFESCYIQTESEGVQGMKAASVVNGAEFKAGEKPSDSNVKGYLWTSGAKAALNALIESKKEAE